MSPASDKRKAKCQHFYFLGRIIIIIIIINLYYHHATWEMTPVEAPHAPFKLPTRRLWTGARWEWCHGQLGPDTHQLMLHNKAIDGPRWGGIFQYNRGIQALYISYISGSMLPATPTLAPREVRTFWIPRQIWRRFLFCLCCYIYFDFAIDESVSRWCKGCRRSWGCACHVFPIWTKSKPTSR